MHHQFLLDTLVFVGGLFLYGARAAIGKWMFTQLLKVLRHLFIRSEEEVKLYRQFVHEETVRRHRSK